ncbi:flagellar type III secretion system protein FliR [Metallumcola ferriviriculae]|uniref:Flagellar biosynthetic protein FliR n=1 Tax=Metallumcola ferriviriculae TaxID=3039180 RepID=A0AAU0UTI9_9FIRM|nr:flagellar type III secretion system protein FliR [Desulfitibacteraceae bacterium MK1]
MVDFQELIGWLLVFTRLSAFVVTAPFFSIKGIPSLVKIGLAVLLTVIIGPFVPMDIIPVSMLGLVFLIAKEVVVGLLLGFTAGLIFQAIKIGGELIDIQMGFAMASLFDPISNTRVTLIGQFQYYYAILLYLVLNGHHSLILAIVRSFQLVPLGSAMLSGILAQHFISIFLGMFAVAFKIAAPVIAVLIISDISLGLVARTVPQLNVFMLGFPIKAALGMLVVALLLPLLAGIVTDLMTQIEKDLLIVMESLS